MNRRLCIVAVAALFLAGAMPGAGLFPAAAASTVDVRAPDDVCFWQTVQWDDLSGMEQALWGTLGWNAGNWESENPDDYPPSEFKAWDELSQPEREMLVRLGYTEETWDNIEDVCGEPA